MIRKKILFLIESFGGGGAEKALLNYLSLIDKERYEVTVCSISDSGPYAAEARQRAEHYRFVLPNPKKLRRVSRWIYSVRYHIIYYWLSPKYIYKTFIPSHHDVEIAFIEGFCTKILAASTNKRAKKLCWVHCNMLKHHWTDSIYRSHEAELRAYQQYHHIITVSEEAKEAFAEVFPVVSHLLRIIYNPIFLPSLDNYYLGNAVQAKSADHILRIVTVGRLEPPKSIDRLLNAVQGLPVELQIVGDGSLRDKLCNEIEALGEQTQVQMLGFLSNPYSVMANADLYVCSSLSEAYSSSVQEAVLLGIPVLTTDCAGMREILHNGAFGMIVENTTVALREGLIAILQDKALLIRYKDALEEYLACFHIPAEQLNTFYSLMDEC